MRRCLFCDYFFFLFNIKINQGGSKYKCIDCWTHVDCLGMASSVKIYMNVKLMVYRVTRKWFHIQINIYKCIIYDSVLARMIFSQIIDIFCNSWLSKNNDFVDVMSMICHILSYIHSIWNLYLWFLRKTIYVYLFCVFDDY